MHPLLFIGIILYVMITLILSISHLSQVDHWEYECKIREFPLMPKHIYNDFENANWLFVILVWLFALVIFPWIFIGYFFYFIFTIGRRKV